ncbi:MAG: GNAT family N-acetyltransferase [Chitinophagales bacterium]
MNNVQIEQSATKGRAFYLKNDQTLAEMTFSKAGSELIIIDHTEVDDSLRGQGIGRKLLDKIIEMVRANNLKVLPLCPYVKSVFDKDASIRDVLK